MSKRDTQIRFRRIQSQEGWDRPLNFGQAKIFHGGTYPFDDPVELAILDESCWRISLSVREVFRSLGIDEQVVENLAQQSQIQDLGLFRAVITLTARASGEPYDYRVFCNGIQFGTEREEVELARRADALAGELEDVLRELISRGERPGDKICVGRLIAWNAAAKPLQEALGEYGRALSKVSVTEFSRSSNRPRAERSRGALKVLAAAWPRLVGKAPSSWEAKYPGRSDARFLTFIRSVFRLLGLPSPSSKSVERWLKELGGQNEANDVKL
jgi:hypothetical protein